MISATVGVVLNDEGSHKYYEKITYRCWGWRGHHCGIFLLKARERKVKLCAFGITASKEFASNKPPPKKKNQTKQNLHSFAKEKKKEPNVFCLNSSQGCVLERDSFRTKSFNWSSYQLIAVLQHPLYNQRDDSLFNQKLVPRPQSRPQLLFTHSM